MFTRNIKEVEITSQELIKLIGLNDTFLVQHIDVDGNDTITVTLLGDVEGTKHGL